MYIPHGLNRTNTCGSALNNYKLVSIIKPKEIEYKPTTSSIKTIPVLSKTIYIGNNIFYTGYNTAMDILPIIPMKTYSMGKIDSIIIKE
jgi:hypothetical protein